MSSRYPWFGGVRRAGVQILAFVGLLILIRAIFLLLQLPAPSPKEQKPPAAKTIPGLFSTVIIDPGHGGVDTGASSHGLQEKVVVLDLAKRLVSYLNDAGITAILTRESDQYVSLADRVRLANSVPNAIFVSLHCNFSDNTAARGIEAYRCVVKSNGIEGRVELGADTFASLRDVENQLAESLEENVVQLVHCEARGAKTANFYVVRNIEFPAVLMECGFLTNPDDAKALSDEGYRERLAEGLAKGIVAYRSLMKPNSVMSVSTATEQNNATVSP